MPPVRRRKVSFRPFFDSLNECKRRGDWLGALELLHAVGQQGLQPNKVASTTAVAACAAGQTGERGGISTPAPRFWGTREVGRWRWAVNLVDGMRAQQLETNLFAWGACVAACEKAEFGSFLPQSSGGNSGAFHERRGPWPLGLDVLKTAQHQGCGEGVVPMSSAMACCEKSRLGWDRALGILRLMPRSSVEANVVSLGAAISSCEKSTIWAPALGLLGAARRSGLQPNTIAVNAAISVCEKFGAWETAMELLPASATAVSFGAALGAFEPGGWPWALQLLRRLAQRGLQPLVSTMNSALGALGSTWRWASELLGHDGLSPDTVSMGAAIGAMARGVAPGCEGPLPGLSSLRRRLQRWPGDHSSQDALVLQAAGRAGRWLLALQVFLDAGEAAKQVPLRSAAGPVRASLLWSQAAWSCEASQKPGAWRLPGGLAIARQEWLLPLCGGRKRKRRDDWHSQWGEWQWRDENDWGQWVKKDWEDDQESVCTSVLGAAGSSTTTQAPPTPATVSPVTPSENSGAVQPKTEPEDDESYSEDEPGSYLHIISPPQPKKMPRPAVATAVATAKYLPRPKVRLPAAPKARPTCKSSALVPLPPPPEREPAFQGRAGPAVGKVSRFNLTSTGLRVLPPSMGMFRNSKRSPLPGPPPTEDPPSWAVVLDVPAALPALPPAECTALAPLAPPGPCAGDDLIKVEIDEGAASVADLLKEMISPNDTEFVHAVQVIKSRFAAALSGTGQAANINFDVQVGNSGDAGFGASGFGGFSDGLGGGFGDFGGGITPPAISPAIAGSAGEDQYYSGNGSWVNALPPSFAVEKIVDVGEIRFSQRSIKRRFQDGKTFEELWSGLRNGSVNPMTSPFLILTVVEKADSRGRRALYSKENRRLYCLKEHQKRVGGELPVRVRILAWHDVVDACKFQRNYDTETDGVEIAVR
ncbi:unnamed protein product [Effrenium voratum]|nr:unnamed protein product [Effrenium voratum]